MSSQELPIQAVVKVAALPIALRDPLLHLQPATALFKCRGVYQYKTEMLRGGNVLVGTGKGKIYDT